MKAAMKRMELFPLFCVGSTHNYGTREVLTHIVELRPSAYEMEEIHAFKGAEGDHTVEIHANDVDPFAAIVFKTQSEPHVGDVSIFRILSGSVRTGDELYNATRDGAEKLNHLAVSHAKARIEAQRLRAAGLGSVARVRTPQTNEQPTTRAQ